MTNILLFPFVEIRLVNSKSTLKETGQNSSLVTNILYPFSVFSFLNEILS